MFSKVFGKKNKDENSDSQLHQKISQMNITQMRSYVRNSIKELEISTQGINEIMKKLNSFDEKKQTYYIKNDDMDEKKKKAFELVIAILATKKIDLETVELAQKFIENYKELIHDFDTRNKQIYTSKLKDAIQGAVMTIEQYVQLQQKMNILDK